MTRGKESTATRVAAPLGRATRYRATTNERAPAAPPGVRPRATVSDVKRYCPGPHAGSVSGNAHSIPVSALPASGVLEAASRGSAGPAAAPPPVLDHTSPAGWPVGDGDCDWLGVPDGVSLWLGVPEGDALPVRVKEPELEPEGVCDCDGDPVAETDGDDDWEGEPEGLGVADPVPVGPWLTVAVSLVLAVADRECDGLLLGVGVVEAVADALGVGLVLDEPDAEAVALCEAVGVWERVGEHAVLTPASRTAPPEAGAQDELLRARNHVAVMRPKPSIGAPDVLGRNHSRLAYGEEAGGDKGYNAGRHVTPTA